MKSSIFYLISSEFSISVQIMQDNSRKYDKIRINVNIFDRNMDKLYNLMLKLPLFVKICVRKVVNQNLVPRKDCMFFGLWLYSSYNVTLRVDRCTHRYLIEPLSKCLHLKTMLASRYSTFHNSLVKSKKLPVRFFARISKSDKRTVWG